MRKQILLKEKEIWLSIVHVVGVTRCVNYIWISLSDGRAGRRGTNNTGKISHGVQAPYLVFLLHIHCSLHTYFIFRIIERVGIAGNLP